MTARESIDYSIECGGLHYVPDGRGVDVVCLWNNLREAQRRYVRWVAAEAVGYAGAFTSMLAAPPNRAGDVCVFVAVVLFGGLSLLAYRRIRVLRRIIDELRCHGLRLDDANNLVRWLPHGFLWRVDAIGGRAQSVWLDRLAESYAGDRAAGQR